MNPHLNTFLAPHTSLITESAVWGQAPLEINTYLSSKIPPQQYITSARGVVFQEDKVLVIKSPSQKYYVVPGGRCEAGETIAETLHREILEETGWAITRPRYFAFVHFRHRGPKPEGYQYSYPDFFQVIYLAQAERHIPDRMVYDQYVVESEFVTIPTARQLNMDESQKLLLNHAWNLLNS